MTLMWIFELASILKGKNLEIISWKFYTKRCPQVIFVQITTSTSWDDLSQKWQKQLVNKERLCENFFVVCPSEEEGEGVGEECAEPGVSPGF